MRFIDLRKLKRARNDGLAMQRRHATLCRIIDALFDPRAVLKSSA